MAILIPMGCGKTYYAAKYHEVFYDIDDLSNYYSEVELVTLNGKRKRALQIDSWDDYNRYYHSLLKTAFSRNHANINGKFVLLHSYDDANALNLKLLAVATYKDFNSVRENLIERGDGDKSRLDLARRNWMDTESFRLKFDRVLRAGSRDSFNLAMAFLADLTLQE